MSKINDDLAGCLTFIVLILLVGAVLAAGGQICGRRIRRDIERDGQFSLLGKHYRVVELEKTVTVTYEVKEDAATGPGANHDAP